MPTQTDLNKFPYFDDYDESKDFSKILFKPSTSVQVRELNQLQTLLQKQIERFGDNVFKKGTIVDGCNFLFNENLSYAKIKDKKLNNELADVSEYVGFFVKNSSNLVSLITNSIVGFESNNPDLNTVYLKYLNSGIDGNTHSYSNSEVLTVYNGNNSLYNISIVDGGTSFSNSDSIVILSALELQNTSGGTSLSNTFVVGELITQSTTGAQALIVSSNSTINSESVVIKIKPLANNLAGSNTLSWVFSTGYAITSNTSAITANVSGSIGSGAVATLTTEGISGTINSVEISARGTGYYVEPQVFVKSTTGSVSSISLLAENYLAKITVDSVGHGYGFGVTSGVIYQKGHFSRVDAQQIIVSKYSNTPDSLSIGFDTTESVVNSSVDSSLLDNVIGTFNENAPGADRLKLYPTLKVISSSSADSNSEFFSVVKFSNGQPYIQSGLTQYNKIETELAKRTYEESGDYVINPFYINSKSNDFINTFSESFTLVIDPGTAYINGYRVASEKNYSVNVDKATNTMVSSQTSASIDYGNYIRIKEVGGTFNFAVGDIVNFYDTNATYVTSAAFGIPASAGTKIGQARIRSIMYESGEPGTPNAIYKLYLFDVRIDQGKNFKNTKSVFYNGTVKGVADLILDVDGTTGLDYASIREPNKSTLLFGTGVNAVKSITNATYEYKNIDYTLIANTSGLISVLLSSPEYFPYVGTLSDNEQEEIIIVPLANGSAATVATGTVSTTAGQSNVIGTATTFITDYTAGDHILVANSTVSEIKRIVSISNNTLLKVSTNLTNSFVGANTKLSFPRYVPIPMSTRTNRTASVSGNTVLTIDLGVALSANLNVSVVHNVKTTANSVTKTVKRLNYVKVQANTNLATNVGPWCLGVSDIFRLRNVYVGGATVNTSSTSIVNEFYIDHNQNDNYYDYGYLYKNPNSSYTLGANDVLLVEYDVMTRSSSGLLSVESYPIDDTISLDDADLIYANSTINTIEIPEVFGTRGSYYDLRDQLDFRPTSANTVVITANAALANTNPVEANTSARFDTVTNKKFPSPQSDIIFDVEHYASRNDRIVLTTNGNFIVLSGIPGAGKNSFPPKPINTLTINTLTIPPYPSLPTILSSDIIKLADTKIANVKFTKKRIDDYRIKTLSNEQSIDNQPKRYTMSEIGSLDRRIRDLEYYVSLNSIETEIRDKVITSTTDPSVNRFKFGFFVDNFQNELYADTQNPSYNATIFDSKLGPKKSNIMIKFKFDTNDANTVASTAGDKISFPYVEETLIQQLSVTDGPVVGTPTTPTTPVVTNFNGIFATKTPEIFSLQGITNKTYISTSPWGGCDTCQSNIPRGYIFTGFKGGTQSQNGVAGIQSGNGVGAGWVSPTYFDGQGTVTHNFNGGYVDFWLNTYSNLEQKFEFILINLKPNSVHNFLFEGFNKTSKCQQIGKAIGTGLISDDSGNLNFFFFYDTDITIDQSSTFTQYQAELSRLAGIKTIKVENSTNTSYASSTLTFAADASVAAATIASNIATNGGLAIGTIGLNLGGTGGGVGGGGGTVICTALRGLGLLSDDIWAADDIYGKYIRATDPLVYYGYELWATPIARWMTEGGPLGISAEFVTSIVSYFAIPWANEMANIITNRVDNKSNKLGKNVMKIGVPLCRFIGKIRNLTSRQKGLVNNGI